MSFGNIVRYSLLFAGLSGLFGGVEIRRTPEELRRWILKMHKDQIELLKMDWGNPGFCTKWDWDYRSQTRSCRKEGNLRE